MKKLPIGDNVTQVEMKEGCLQASRCNIFQKYISKSSTHKLGDPFSSENQMEWYLASANGNMGPRKANGPLKYTSSRIRISMKH
jgi:hypothetical protein